MTLFFFTVYLTRFGDPCDFGRRMSSGWYVDCRKIVNYRRETQRPGYHVTSASHKWHISVVVILLLGMSNSLRKRTRKWRRDAYFFDWVIKLKALNDDSRLLAEIVAILTRISFGNAWKLTDTVRILNYLSSLGWTFARPFFLIYKTWNRH